MERLTVTNLKRNGRSIVNQFLIYYYKNGKKYKIYQSYSSMILKWKNGILIEVGLGWDYSRTTGKYRNLMTGLDKKAFEKMLKNEFEWSSDTQSYLRKK